MDQGVVACLKRLCRKKLLRKLILVDDKKSATTFYKGIYLKYLHGDTCVEWFKPYDKNVVEEFPNDSDIPKIVLEIPGSSESEEKEVKKWLSRDQDDPGFQLMTEDEIIDSLSYTLDFTKYMDCSTSIYCGVHIRIIKNKSCNSNLSYFWLHIVICYI